MALGMSQRAVASGARVFEILDRDPRLVTEPNAPPLPDGRGRIEFRGVSFAYEEGGPVLERRRPHDRGGRDIALVGATASGKTSLSALVPRLYDVTAGSVAIDGADVRSVELGSLRQQTALVADDAFLFSASLRENIAYARKTRPTPRSTTPRAARASTSSSNRFRTAMRPASASAA